MRTIAPFKYRQDLSGFTLHIEDCDGVVDAQIFDTVDEAREYWLGLEDKQYVIDAPVIRGSDGEVVANFA